MAERQDFDGSLDSLEVNNGNDVHFFIVQEVKSSFLYTFCCIKIQLQHVVEELDGSMARMDAFFRSDESKFDRILPARVKVTSGCLIPVSSPGLC